MKTFLWLVIILVLVVGGWLLWGGSADSELEMIDETIGENMEENTEDETSDTNDDNEATENVVEVDLTAKNFAFSSSEIRVKEGDTVRLTLTSEEGFHDWVVDEFNAATSQINTGGVTTVEFVADQAGTYEYYCSVGSHRQMGMVGSLIVE